MRGEQQALVFAAGPAKPPVATPPPRPAAPRTPRAPAPQLSLSFDARAEVCAAPVEPPPAPAHEPAIGAFLAHEHPGRSALEAAIARALGRPVALELTTNRRTMISTSRVEGRLQVRLHRMFLEAGDDVVIAIGRYLSSGDRRASRVLGDYIGAHRDLSGASARRGALRPIGAHHDLREIFAQLERTEFPGQLEGVSITWGRHGPPGRRRSIRLGTYTHAERLIRVHPTLDAAWVPRAFVEYIVFHEMLHHVEPGREEAHRVVYHTDAFRRREEAYHGYQAAIAWERQHLKRLLGGR